MIADHLDMIELCELGQTAERKGAGRLVIGPAAMTLLRERLEEMGGIDRDARVRLVLVGMPTDADDRVPSWGWQLERAVDGVVVSAGRFTVHDVDCRTVPDV